MDKVHDYSLVTNGEGQGAGYPVPSLFTGPVSWSFLPSAFVEERPIGDGWIQGTLDPSKSLKW